MYVRTICERIFWRRSQGECGYLAATLIGESAQRVNLERRLHPLISNAQPLNPPADMNLDPESTQVRDVYAHYGLAMYWAQCLEQSIFQHLLFFDHFPKAVASYTTAENWALDFDKYEARELGQTMGKLVRRLRDAGQPTAPIEQLLNETLKGRNWLAHGYFADRAIEFTMQDGRERMIAELEALRELFRTCADQLDTVTLPVARSLGLTDEKLAHVEAELVATYGKHKSEA